MSRSSFLYKYYYPKSKDEQILYLKQQHVFSSAKFSKYCRSVDHSNYRHEKGFPTNLPKLTMLQIRYKELYSFFTDIFSSANFTGRHVWSGCFFDSLFLTWFVSKYHSATATISAKLFLVLGMTRNCVNAMSNHGQSLWSQIPRQSKDLRNSQKLRKLVAI